MQNLVHVDEEAPGKATQVDPALQGALAEQVAPRSWSCGVVALHPTTACPLLQNASHRVPGEHPDPPAKAGSQGEPPSPLSTAPASIAEAPGVPHEVSQPTDAIKPIIF